MTSGNHTADFYPYQRDMTVAFVILLINSLIAFTHIRINWHHRYRRSFYVIIGFYLLFGTPLSCIFPFSFLLVTISEPCNLWVNVRKFIVYVYQLCSPRSRRGLSEPSDIPLYWSWWTVIIMLTPIWYPFFVSATIVYCFCKLVYRVGQKLTSACEEEPIVVVNDDHMVIYERENVMTHHGPLPIGGLRPTRIIPLRQ